MCSTRMFEYEYQLLWQKVETHRNINKLANKNCPNYRFPKYTNIIWPVTFQTINVSAAFERSDDKIQFPNSLIASLKPISPQNTLWNKIESHGIIRRNHILTTPHAKVLTFGIFGRDFSRDSLFPSKSNINKSSYITAILLVILSTVLVIFNIL